VLEIRPPVSIDKGAGVRRLIEESGRAITAALYTGDDTTDLDAFRALEQLRREGRLTTAIRVGVASEEAPSEITAEADIVVDGPGGVGQLLALLLAGE